MVRIIRLRFLTFSLAFFLVVFLVVAWHVPATPALEKDLIYQVPHLTPRENQGILKVGDPAPDFTLPTLREKSLTLSSFRGKKIVVLSFVPAAFTPVCSAQWPMYNMAQALFEKYHAEVIGITTDNLPSLYAWTKGMGEIWFPVLSDFWPHGKVCKRYGILRHDGTAERALFVIDRQGVIRYIDIHDINQRPPLDDLDRALAEVAAQPFYEKPGPVKR
jgi:peroxiredoxin (alkyl hydroperoxide reductase subunit C)